jgi:cobalt/nickel transport system ATP-binding protein
MHTNGYLLPQINHHHRHFADKTRQEIRKKVGLIFQNPDDQLFMPTVFDDVAFGPLNLGLSPERVNETVAEALETVGCIALKDKPPHHLSGGQKSAVAIASVICTIPRLLRSHDLDLILMSAGDAL